MLRTIGKKAAFVGLLGTSALMVLPALAQDNGAARKSTFNVSLGLEAGRNLALDPGGSDTSTELKGGLSYSYEMNTPRTQMRFQAGLNPKFSNDTDTRPLPRLTFGLTQSSPRTELRFGASYTRTQVSDLEIGYDETGAIIFYDGTGERSSAQLSAGFTGGIDMPFGYKVDLSRSELDYHDTTPFFGYDPSSTTRGSLELRADLSAASQLRFTLSRSVYEVEDATDLTRTTDKASLRLDQRIDAITSMNLSFGQSRVESERITGTDTQSGATFGFGLMREDQVGHYALDFAHSITESGKRDQISVLRSLETRLGSFDGMVGLSRGEADTTDVIARVAYSLELPRDQLDFSLSRVVSNDNAGDDVVVTRLSGKLSHDLSDVNALDFGLSASMTEAVTQDTTRLDASVAYRHALTPDADLSAGVKMSLAQRTGREDADSERVFLTLSRRFEAFR